jgi:hypothetical protein
VRSCPEEDGVQFTIEARQLTSAPERRRDDGPQQTTVDALNPHDAIFKFVQASDCELMSFTPTTAGRESIGTVRKEDSVFLVRVYAA